MKNLNNEEFVKEQYETSYKLDIRMSIHAKYSTNKVGFGNWIISNYHIKPNSRILELGCGTGGMWHGHMDLLNENCQLILTDFSSGMLETAKSTLGTQSNITYEVVNIEDIPYEDSSFDAVIANMMLYHVPDIHKALDEVRRVLKPGGSFYCATFGENGIIQFIGNLLKEYGVLDSTNKNFTLQNGYEILNRHFSKVERRDYKDSLAVTNVEDMLDYVYSCTSMTNITEVRRDRLKKILEDSMENGVLNIPKEYGMFICK